MTVGEFLAQTERLFKEADITSPRLDAQILLADTLGKDKSWLLAHPDWEIETKQVSILSDLAGRRAQRIPLAYLRGKQEFYGREFHVNTGVLIPRPETEMLLTTLQDLPIKNGDKIIDIGTGSGAIACTAALELPQAAVYATDISSIALQVAQKNAQQLQAKVTFSQQNILEQDKNGPYHVIIANLPYVDKTWERSPETDSEPSLALFASDNGTELIKKLILQAPLHLMPKGYLLLEADPRQHQELVGYASVHGFSGHATYEFCVALRLIS